ncbi:MAG TPA: magnesium transporter CorA family protein [Chitinophagales bacterium]|nr:magnesium transporter CorA family protein [Chitinophagales bacterium]
MIEIFKKVNGELVKLDTPESDCWINVYPPFTTDDLEKLSKDLEIPLDFLTDSIDLEERSRYEYEDGVKLIVLNTPVLNEKNLLPDNKALYVTIPIGIVLLEDKILTISPYPNPVIDSFINKRVKNFDTAARTRFVIQMLDRNVYYFLHYLKQINNKRNLFEEELFHSSRNKELAQLMNLQKSLVYFVTTLRANELMMMKMQRTDFLKIEDDEELQDIMQDVIVDNSQALDMSNVYTNILNGTMDAFASIISNNLNIVMRRLTSVTILLMVPTLVTSFYGMNVYLPGQNNHLAVFMILSGSLLIAALLAWFFMRKQWF